VEDERPLLEAVKAKLETRGFEVVSARTVEQALDYIRGIDHVDAIWLDHYLLGKENGLDLVKKLKAEGSHSNQVPIFVVSNTAGPQTVQTYLHLGVKKYYVKAEHRLDDIIKDIEASMQ
jgi:DNA-binding response OmpR family regulator